MADKGILTRVAERFARSSIQLKDQEISQLGSGYDFLQERLAELELAIEDIGWTKISGDQDKEFTQEARKKIAHLARIFFFKNPLIKRAVLTQTQYVFGQGVEISAEHEEVNKVVQEFLGDEKNRVELTDHQAKQIKETELQLFANLFFVFFIDKVTGKVKVRTFPEGEIVQIICNPDDSKEPWYYKRVWRQSTFNSSTGRSNTETMTRYYPDWKLPVKERQDTINGKPTSDAIVYHVKTNALSDMKFGVSEVYAALDWAKAYTKFMEDWATVTNALAKFAWNYKAKGSTNIAKVKNKLNLKLTGSQDSSVYPPVPGSVNIGQEDMKPIKTANAQVSMKDGQQMIHMVSAATGIFYHYLAGDPSTGNLATAKAMERPMEIMFRDRQELWESIFNKILNLAIRESIKAPKGILHKLGTVRNVDGTEVIEMKNDTTNTKKSLQDKPINIAINIDFPELLEKDVKELMESIKSANDVLVNKGDTLVSEKLIVKEILNALQISDVDEVLLEMFSDEFIKGRDLTDLALEGVSVVEAARNLKKVIEHGIKQEAIKSIKNKK